MTKLTLINTKQQQYQQKANLSYFKSKIKQNRLITHHYNCSTRTDKIELNNKKVFKEIKNFNLEIVIKDY